MAPRWGVLLAAAAAAAFAGPSPAATIDLAAAEVGQPRYLDRDRTLFVSCSAAVRRGSAFSLALMRKPLMRSEAAALVFLYPDDPADAARLTGREADFRAGAVIRRGLVGSGERSLIFALPAVLLDEADRGAEIEVALGDRRWALTGVGPVVRKLDACMERGSASMTRFGLLFGLILERAGTDGLTVSAEKGGAAYSWRGRDIAGAGWSLGDGTARDPATMVGGNARCERRGSRAESVRDGRWSRTLHRCEAPGRTVAIRSLVIEGNDRFQLVTMAPDGAPAAQQFDDDLFEAALSLMAAPQ